MKICADAIASLDDINVIIGQSGLFGSLEAHTQQLLSEQSRRVTANAVEFVYHQGQASKKVYLIIKGNAHSLRTEDDPESIAGNLVAGEGFGLMDLLALRPRTLSVVAITDGETVSQIQENPYLQYFVGLAGYQMAIPFVPSLRVEVRKRMGDAGLLCRFGKCSIKRCHAAGLGIVRRD